MTTTYKELDNNYLINILIFNFIPMEIIKDIARNLNVSEKNVAEIMKAWFFIWRDCRDYKVASEIIAEFDKYCR